MAEKKVVPNLSAAKMFLAQFSGDHFIQTFDDNKERAAPILINSFQNMAGIDSISEELVSLNRANAGIYFCVNQINGAKKTYENVKCVRAHFVDLDGSPLDPVLRFELVPDILVRTSAEKYHAYWMLSSPAEPDPFRFRAIQRGIIEKFAGDRSIIDLPRVMRIPGFFNMKAKPFMIEWSLYNKEMQEKYIDGKLTIDQIFHPEVAT